MSSEPFKTIHHFYKRLNRIKALVRMQSSNLSTSYDVFDVFSSRLKELLITVESKFAKDGISEAVKIRLAAIQLALHFIHLESLLQLSLAWSARVSVAEINAEIQIVENQMRQFDEWHLNEVMCLVYFKLISLLAKINYNPLKNVNIAKQWLESAERMYEELEQVHSVEEKPYYDLHELFSKSATLVPSPAGRVTLHKLYAENKVLLEQIHCYRNNEALSVIEWLRTHQDNSIWLTKLLSIVPQLLEQTEFKIVAYLLLIARKLATEKDEVDIQSSIATSWMYYFLGVFDRSKQILHTNLTEDKMIFRQSYGLKRMYRKMDANSSGDVNRSNVLSSKSIFNCFADSIPLSREELRLCTNRLENVNDAKTILVYSIEMVEKLIREIDFRQNPMDFIIHHYQISDLLSISTNLTENSENCFNFQVQRFQYLQKMMQWIDKYHPDVFNTLAVTFLSDFNEVILDLYALNYDRIFHHMNFNTDDKQQIRQQLKDKFAEMHEVNKHVIASKTVAKETYIA